MKSNFKTKKIAYVIKSKYFIISYKNVRTYKLIDTKSKKSCSHIRNSSSVAYARLNCVLSRTHNRKKKAHEKCVRIERQKRMTIKQQQQLYKHMYTRHLRHTIHTAQYISYWVHTQTNHPNCLLFLSVQWFVLCALCEGEVYEKCK